MLQTTLPSMISLYKMDEGHDNASIPPIERHSFKIKHVTIITTNIRRNIKILLPVLDKFIPFRCAPKYSYSLSVRNCNSNEEISFS